MVHNCLRQSYYGMGALWAAYNTRSPIGRNIYDVEWDICIILDSTRVDMLRDLLPVHFADWRETPEIDAAWSVGSVTTEWLGNTFRPEHAPAIAETGMVCATPHSETVFGERSYLTNNEDVAIPYPTPNVVDRDDFAGFHELWRTHATVENVVPPETMRDATIQAYAEYPRVVAHWMQPHEPFIAPTALLTGGHATEEGLWKAMDEYDTSEVWQSYCANLSYALKHVRTVVENVDARVLVTSDHGNAFGEWGVYGHPFGWPQPEVRKVPWVVFEGSDVGEHTPEDVLTTTGERVDRDDQLRSLGYL